MKRKFSRACSSSDSTQKHRVALPFKRCGIVLVCPVHAFKTENVYLFNTEPTVSSEADRAEPLVQPEDRVSFNKCAKTQPF